MIKKYTVKNRQCSFKDTVQKSAKKNYLSAVSYQIEQRNETVRGFYRIEKILGIALNIFNSVSNKRKSVLITLQDM